MGSRSFDNNTRRFSWRSGYAARVDKETLTGSNLVISTFIVSFSDCSLGFLLQSHLDRDLL